MIPTVAYHGGHVPPVEASSVQRWEGAGCLAFVHDIMDSPQLPLEFAPCDVLVADLPWQKGYETFNERAGVDDGRTYASFMARVGELAESATVPTWLVTGKHALPKLPGPHAVLEMKLNEWDAIAIGYRPGPETEGRYGMAQEFLFGLAQQYDCAGDFCAGYGRTGRSFVRSGKRAVLSDFNTQCIGYIAANATSWVERPAPF
jgi:hypothetical protein